MNKQTFTIPDGCKAISMEIIDNAIITTFEHEFKKGDIIFGEQNGAEIILILDSILAFSYIARYSVTHNRVNSTPSTFSSLFNLRFATDTEKQLLFYALAKENKMWDAEKMEIVELKYIPKVGDCVKLDNGNLIIYFCVKDETDKYVNSKYMITGDSIENDIDYDKCGGYIKNSYDRIYTKITPEELQAEFNKLGYEYDFETHEAKKIKFEHKDMENYYFLTSAGKVYNQKWIGDSIDLEREKFGNCFKTEAEAQKIKDYILEYEAQNN